MGVLLMAAALLFPSLSAENLEGTAFELPRDFEGELTLVLIAFKREQQQQVDSWIPSARELSSRYGERFAFYELPVLARGWSLMRGWIDGGMRSGIADPAIRRATITLYTDKSAFMESLAIEHDETIQALLLDDGGQVRWRREGPADEATLNELREQLEAALGEEPGEPAVEAGDPSSPQDG